MIETLWRQGARLRDGINSVVAKHELQNHFTLGGRPCCLTYATRDARGNPSQEFRTLFLQETIRRGLIAPSFVVSYSHSDAVIDQTIEIFDAALAVYSQALENGIEKFLSGRSVRPVFRKYN
ncbi:MAG: hypothetical protein JO333_17540 [Verrucomicrobia bacterium]|nr:hypothetical protein [Verrucomicrobiota bacterium]